MGAVGRARFCCCRGVGVLYQLCGAVWLLEGCWCPCFATPKAGGGGDRAFGVVGELGHAKGGGALSAVAAIKSPVIFIGTGELQGGRQHILPSASHSCIQRVPPPPKKIFGLLPCLVGALGDGHPQSLQLPPPPPHPCLTPSCLAVVTTPHACLAPFCASGGHMDQFEVFVHIGIGPLHSYTPYCLSTP